MGELADDVDRPSSSDPHAVEPRTMSAAPGGEDTQAGVRSAEGSEAMDPQAQSPKEPSQTTVEGTQHDAAAAPQEDPGSALPDVDNTSTPAEPAQSHPMTTTTSASSHLSNKDSNPAGAAYGTRSRNRPGVPRPNYAEDVEMDFEVAQQANGAEHSSMDLSSHSPPATDSRQSPSPGGKRGTPAANGWNALNGNSSSIPGTSHFSANPNARMPHSRKRKAAEVQGTASAHSQSPAPSVPVVTRRANAAATAASQASSYSYMPDNNMFSFDRCRSSLNKQGRLVADDGTVFSVNGKRLILPHYFYGFLLCAY